MRSSRSPHRSRQRGGITILIVLSLLVLVTAAAVGMSRNSLREVMIVGSARESAIVRNTADAGVEYSLAWLKPDATPPSTAAAGILLHGLQSDIAFQRNSKDQGSLYSIPTASDSYVTPAGSSTPAKYDLSLMHMGFSSAPKTSVQGTEAATQKGQLILWDARSQATMTIGSQTFQYTRETWLTTPRTGFQ